MSASEPLRRYLVSLQTPLGEAQIEVPTHLGPEAAGRRAWLAGVQQRWGDVGEVVVTAISEISAVSENSAVDAISQDETGPGSCGNRIDGPSPAAEGAP